MTYQARVISMSVGPTDEPIFSELATTITIVDESGGEFVEVSQEGRDGLGKIVIDRDEWPTMRETIDNMIAMCR